VKQHNNPSGIELFDPKSLDKTPNQGISADFRETS
jgi:hypothetical protein